MFETTHATQSDKATESVTERAKASAIKAAVPAWLCVDPSNCDLEHFEIEEYSDRKDAADMDYEDYLDFLENTNE